MVTAKEKNVSGTRSRRRWLFGMNEVMMACILGKAILLSTSVDNKKSITACYVP